MLSRTDFPRTLEVLERYGATTVAAMREKLTSVRQRRTGRGRLRSLRTNAVATGALERSIAYTIVDGTATYTVEFTMADHGVYVDRGRRPGRFPPLEAIREWARIKGIPESAAFPIARRIAEEGIAARPFFSSTVEETRPQFLEELEAAYAEDLAALIARKLNASQR